MPELVKLVVEALPVRIIFVPVILPVTRALPETVRVEPGVVVPIPTFPVVVEI